MSYDRLVDDFESEIRRLASVLPFQVEESRLKCLLRDRDGQFKRKKRRMRLPYNRFERVLMILLPRTISSMLHVPLLGTNWSAPESSFARPTYFSAKPDSVRWYSMQEAIHHQLLLIILI